MPSTILLGLIVAILVGLLTYGIYTFVQKRRVLKEKGDTVNLVLVDEDKQAEQDSDNDGVPDWEENIWAELDPNNPDSDNDGVSDLDYIRQKKREYETEYNQASGITERISESDRLGRGLYTALAALIAEGDISEGDREAVVDNVSGYISDLNLSDRTYLSSDFYLVDNGIDESLTYKKELADLAEKYPMRLDEFELILTASSEPDAHAVDIQHAKLKYEQYLNDLQFIAVPMGISKQHIELTNIVGQITGILENLSQDTENVDDIILLASLIQVESLFDRTVQVLYEMGIYFEILTEDDTFADQGV